MPFLKFIEPRPGFPPDSDFPFSLEIVETIKKIEFDAPVTFFVGENGSGKSTLLEAIAAGFNLPTLGSYDVAADPTLAAARRFAKVLRFARSRPPKRGFFFRSEDFFGFTKRVMQSARELQELEDEYSETLSGYGRDLAVGMARGQRQAYESRYGSNPDAASHGESTLNALGQRLVPDGLYLLDEPETPLAPVAQLALLAILKEKVAENCQFIIATHSPILMAFPNALIYLFESGKITPAKWDELEHVNITRAFLNNPESFLRRL